MKNGFTGSHHFTQIPRITSEKLINKYRLLYKSHIILYMYKPQACFRWETVFLGIFNDVL